MPFAQKYGYDHPKYAHLSLSTMEGLAVDSVEVMDIVTAAAGEEVLARGTPTAEGAALALDFGPFNGMFVSRILLPYAFFPDASGFRRSMIELALQKMTSRTSPHTDRRFYTPAAVPKPVGLEIVTDGRLELTRAHAITLHAAQLRDYVHSPRGPNKDMLPAAPTFQDRGNVFELWVAQVGHPRCSGAVSLVVEWALTPYRTTPHRVEARPAFAAACAEYARAVAVHVADVLLTTVWEVVRGVQVPFLQGDPYLVDSLHEIRDATVLQATWALDTPMFPQAERPYAKYTAAAGEVGRFWALTYAQMARAGNWDSLVPGVDDTATGGVVPPEQVWTLRKAEWTPVLPPELATTRVPVPGVAGGWGPATPAGACLVGYLYIQAPHAPHNADARRVVHDDAVDLTSGLANIVKAPAVVQIVPRAWEDLDAVQPVTVHRQACALTLQFQDARVHLRHLPPTTEAVRTVRRRQRDMCLGIPSIAVHGNAHAALGQDALTRLLHDLNAKVLSPMAWRLEYVASATAQARSALPLAMALDGEANAAAEAGKETTTLSLYLVMAWLAPLQRPMARGNGERRLRARYTTRMPRVAAVLGGLQHTLPGSWQHMQAAGSPFGKYYEPEV